MLSVGGLELNIYRINHRALSIKAVGTVPQELMQEYEKGDGLMTSATRIFSGFPS